MEAVNLGMDLIISFIEFEYQGLESVISGM